MESDRKNFKSLKWQFRHDELKMQKLIIWNWVFEYFRIIDLI